MNTEQGISNKEMIKDQTADQRKFDLGKRFIDFAVLVIEISESLYHSAAGSHISGQIVRSGTSPALQYGEAQSA